MSDPVMDVYTKAYESSGKKIQAFGVITSSGQVLWQSSNWDLTADAASLVAAVRNKSSSVTQNQVKYSTLQSRPDSLVARSVAGHGILILARIDDEKWVCAWASPDASPDQVYVDVDRAARALKGKI